MCNDLLQHRAEGVKSGIARCSVLHSHRARLVDDAMDPGTINCDDLIFRSDPNSNMGNGNFLFFFLLLFLDVDRRRKKRRGGEGRREGKERKEERRKKTRDDLSL